MTRCKARRIGSAARSSALTSPGVAFQHRLVKPQFLGELAVKAIAMDPVPDPAQELTHKDSRIVRTSMSRVPGIGSGRLARSTGT
jgi:hypothetical protein